MAKTPTPKALAGVSIENLRGKAKGVTMQPAGQPMGDSSRPSNTIPKAKNTNPKPVAKPAPAKPKAKVKSPDCTVSPYGIHC